EGGEEAAAGVHRVRAPLWNGPVRSVGQQCARDGPRTLICINRTAEDGPNRPPEPEQTRAPGPGPSRPGATIQARACGLFPRPARPPTPTFRSLHTHARLSGPPRGVAMPGYETLQKQVTIGGHDYRL